MWELSSTQGLSEEQIKERIQQRRRQVLVHSYLYYHLDHSIIEDRKFDYLSKDLVDLQEKYPELSKDVPFYEELKGFDGTTGFHLKYKSPTIVNAANRLLSYHKQEQEKSFSQSYFLSVVDPEEIPL